MTLELDTVWDDLDLDSIKVLAERWGKDDALLGDGWGFLDVVLADHAANFFTTPTAREQVVRLFERKGPGWMLDNVTGPLTERLIEIVERETGLTNCL